MNLRRLSDEGLDQFRAYLNQLKLDSTLPPPYHLLDGNGVSQTASTKADIEARSFASRLEAGQYLASILNEAAMDEVTRDTGLWAWLSLYYFDQVCPPDASGKRKPKEQTRYVPAVSDFRKYYRHCLLGPFVIVQAHRACIDDARAILLSPLHIVNDIVEQLASRAGWITNPAVVGAATSLYVTPDGTAYKKGARGKGEGSARRLSEVLDQLDVTYDLYGIPKEELLELLPREFDRFRKT